MIRPSIAAALLIGLIAPLASLGMDSVDEKLLMRPVLGLAAAKDIASAAEAEARANNRRVAIAIVDGAGQLLYFQRMDDTTNASVDIAIAKAQHAANYQRDTKFHQELLENGNNLVLALPASMPIEGGLRLMVDGRVIGGIGVAGAQASEGGRIAKAGAARLAE